ncbi:MAG: anti-sigma factor [Verrucomicrobiota bacterium]|nr:anti-sigma factor [Verrucomicrobiota bacterium]
MISETQQDQAALYALDLLGAEETTAFERELSANAELQTLVRELRDAAGSVALTAPQNALPSAALKTRVMQQIAAESRDAAPANVITPPKSAFGGWIPWAIAAALALFCGVLAVDREKLRERLAEETHATPVLVALAPQEAAPPKAEAMVAWQPDQQSGTIKIKNLPAAGPGKDYQLWAVDAAHKNPVDAGILHMTGAGVAEIRFQPKDTARQVQAFAISLEREGGVPKAEGPMLFVGKI